MTHVCTPKCVPWTGTNKCHCSTCGETFTGITAFDKHRDKGKCIDPDSCGLMRNLRGFWGVPDTRDWGEDSDGSE